MPVLMELDFHGGAQWTGPHQGTLTSNGQVTDTIGMAWWIAKVGAVARPGFFLATFETGPCSNWPLLAELTLAGPWWDGVW